MIDTGKVSESVVIAHLISLGWNVSIPFSDRCVYDLISESNDGFKRIQVKTALVKMKNPGMKANGKIRYMENPVISALKGRSTGVKTPYTRSEIDLVIGVSNGQCYVHDTFDVTVSRSIATCKTLQDHPIFSRKSNE